MFRCKKNWKKHRNGSIVEKNMLTTPLNEQMNKRNQWFIYVACCSSSSYIFCALIFKNNNNALNDASDLWENNEIVQIQCINVETRARYQRGIGEESGVYKCRWHQWHMQRKWKTGRINFGMENLIWWRVSGSAQVSARQYTHMCRGGERERNNLLALTHMYLCVKRWVWQR